MKSVGHQLPYYARILYVLQLRYLSFDISMLVQYYFLRLAEWNHRKRLQNYAAPLKTDYYCALIVLIAIALTLAERGGGGAVSRSGRSVRTEATRKRKLSHARDLQR